MNSLQQLSVGGSPNWAPIEYLENDEHQGISSDYLNILSDAIGKKLSLKKIKTWSQVLDDFKNREVDVLSAVTKRDEYKEFINYSKPYASIALAVAVKSNSILFQSLKQN